MKQPAKKIPRPVRLWRGEEGFSCVGLSAWAADRRWRAESADRPFEPCVAVLLSAHI
jgi:hypothetical protein